MRIKHYAGYGIVNAFKERADADSLAVIVKGNHEYGIDRHDDYYDVFKWLVTRFDKSRADWRDIDGVDFEYCDDEEINGVRTEVARYVIHFRNRVA